MVGLRYRGTARRDDRPPHEMTLGDLFYQQARMNPQAPYVLDGDMVLRYGECDELACRFASAAAAHGAVKGERVGLVTGNCPEYLVSLQACFKAGLAAVPLNGRSARAELVDHIATTGCRVLVAGAECLPALLPAMEEGRFPDLAAIVVVGDAAAVRPLLVRAASSTCEDRPAFVAWDAFISSGSPVEPGEAVAPDDIALLQYTGGTTGYPKAAKLTHRNLASAAWVMRGWVRPVIGDAPVRALAVQPLYHIMGIVNSVSLCLVDGGSIVLASGVTPRDVVEAADLHRPNYFAAVPTLLAKIADYAPAADSRLRDISLIVVGGSPIPGEIRSHFEGHFGIRLLQGYGMSEVPIIGMELPGSRVGGLEFMPGIEYRLDGERAGTAGMAPGELLVRGPAVTPGYWDDPDETARAFDDGWFRTGDIARIGDGRRFNLVGRSKEVIVSSGFNVYPQEVDEVLFGHPAVHEACTIGVPDPRRVEVGKSFVVLEPGLSADEQELIAWCREHLTPYKVPAYIEFVDSLPKTPAGKPNRRALEQMEEGKGCEEDG